MKDLTVNVPDELLCQMFGYIPSISDRFKLAAMNRKFRRCIMTVLEKPMALELRLDYINRGGERLNGCRVPLNDWPTALQVLAPKTQFESIACVGDYPYYYWDGERYVDTYGERKREFLETILKILIEADCLHQLVSFESSCLFQCGLDVLCGFFAACAKLTVLDMGELLDYGPSLAVALGKKALTELSLTFDWFHNGQASLWELFTSLVPHKLRKVHLSFYEIRGGAYLAQLVPALAQSAWSGLEDVSICFCREPHVPLNMQQLFQALLSSLPMLRRCRVVNRRARIIGINQELLPAMSSVLNESDRATQLAVVYKDTCPYLPPTVGIPVCALVDMIHELQFLHPFVRFDFDQDMRYNLIFELDNVSLLLQVVYSDCNDADCVNSCHSFYSIVVDRLARLALLKTSAHLANYWLDRCRVSRVPTDIKYYKRPIEVPWEVMEVPQVTEVNEGPDLVTFTFANPAGDEFYISMATGQCFFSPCLGCLDID